MLPTPQRFEVNQYPISGGCLLFGGLTLLLLLHTFFPEKEKEAPKVRFG